MKQIVSRIIFAISLVSNSAVALTGGKVTKDNRFDGVFAFSYSSHNAPSKSKTPMKHNCTASVVGEHKILTAGHCVVEWYKDAIQNKLNGQSDSILILGRGKLSKMKSLTIVDVHIHPRFLGNIFIVDENSTEDNFDLAVITVQENLPGPKYAIIRDIPEFSDSTLILTGYGCDRSKPKVEQRSIFRVGYRTDAILGGGKIILPEQSAEIRNRSNICAGDSGGPAFVADHDEMIIIGVNTAKKYDSELETTKKTVNGSTVTWTTTIQKISTPFSESYLTRVDEVADRQYYYWLRQAIQD